ncbi:MAG: hypothetical protein KAW52_02870 [candidate division Zixibacteria bacterium]|nr:hypothetical protein [candidate division Zixibacteria bacterium]
MNLVKDRYLFPAKGGDPSDKRFSAGSRGQVKLKLDTPVKSALISLEVSE